MVLSMDAIPKNCVNEGWLMGQGQIPILAIRLPVKMQSLRMIYDDLLSQSQRCSDCHMPLLRFGQMMP